MANFKVGDTVVCLSAKGRIGLNRYLKAGDKYVVNGIVKCEKDLMVGLSGISGTARCPLCMCCEPHDFMAWRFIKLDGLTEHHEEKETANA